MAYDLTNEVLFWLTHDPERKYWEKFNLTFKGYNPFEVAQGALFELIRKYSESNKIPAYDVLEHEVKSQDTGPAFAARIAIDELRGYRGDVTLFDTALQSLRDRWIERATLQSTKVAQEIVVSGYRKGKIELKGIDSAWQYLNEQRQKILDVQNASDSSGNLFDDVDKLWDRYHAVKKTLSPQGEITGRMATGINMIDHETGGMAGGEFWVIAAYMGEGKSTMLRCLAYNLAVMQGKNVVYATAEMTKRQIENMLVSRHSCNELWQAKVDLKHEAIPYRAIRDGRVASIFKSDRDDGTKAERFLRATMDDLKNGYKSGEYGLLDVLQVPGKMTIPDLNDYLSMKNRERKIDAIFIDYALLFASHVRTNDTNEMMASKIRACKMLALDFGTREQLAVVTAHQINRTGKSEADKLTGPKNRDKDSVVPYSARSLAGTAEAEKSADVALWLMLNDEHRQKAQIRVGFLKNREGSLGRPFCMGTKLECSFLANMEYARSKYGF
jgi:replicative DNA helicase